MTTPKLDEVRRALDTLRRFVESFDAFLSPVVARAEGVRPAAAIQEPRGRPFAVHGRRDNQGDVLAALKSLARPAYMGEIIRAIQAANGGGLLVGSHKHGIAMAMKTMAEQGVLKRDTVAKLWSLQAKIVLDRPVTVTRESDNESH